MLLDVSLPEVGVAVYTGEGLHHQGASCPDCDCRDRLYVFSLFCFACTQCVLQATEGRSRHCAPIPAVPIDDERLAVAAIKRGRVLTYGSLLLPCCFELEVM